MTVKDLDLIIDDMDIASDFLNEVANTSGSLEVTVKANTKTGYPLMSVSGPDKEVKNFLLNYYCKGDSDCLKKILEKRFL